MFFGKSPEQQMQEQLVKVKFLVNTLNKNSQKSKTKEKQFAKKAKKALSINDEATAKVYARQSIQHKNMALKLLKLACRMDILESQIKSHVETNKISTQVVNIINDLTKLCSPTMTLSNINEFEHLMDDATVATNYTADVLDGATVDGTSTKEEEELLEMARDDIDLQLKSSLSIDFPKLNSVIDKPVTASRGADLF